METENNKESQIQIELKEDVAQGTYANLAIISHGSSEFVIDFVRMMPGLMKAGVQSRIIMNPENAKRLMYVLQQNVLQYEHQFGAIRMPEEHQAQPASNEGKTFIPSLNDFKGDA